MVLAIVLLIRAAILGSGVGVGLYKWRREVGSARGWWLGFSILCAALLVLAVAQPFVWNNLDPE